jgi:hypothetical protein
MMGEQSGKRNGCERKIEKERETERQRGIEREREGGREMRVRTNNNHN